MKYNDKFPDMQYEVEEAPPGIIRTKRLYACGGCRKVTGWRDVTGHHLGQPCCSDECFEVIHAAFPDSGDQGVVEGGAEGAALPDPGPQDNPTPSEAAEVKVPVDV